MEIKKIIERYLNSQINFNLVKSFSGRDYNVFIYKWHVFRIPKHKKSNIELSIEKQKLDIIKKYVSLTIPQYTILENSCIHYPEIKWEILPHKREFYTNNIILQIVTFLKQTHSIPLNEFSFLKNNESNNNDLRKFVDGLKLRIKDKLINKVDNNTIILLNDYMEDLFFEHNDSIDAFIHWDIQWKNLIYDKKTKTISWVIDFSDSRIWSIENDFCHFLDLGEEIFNKIIIEYRGFFDKEFSDRVFFLKRREIIFEIDNEEIFQNNFNYILAQLKRFKFLN